MVKLAVMFNSDTIGDVMFLESDDEDYFGYWASQGVLTQLDAYVKRDKVPFEPIQPGKVGMSVRTLKTYQALTYDGRGNIDLNRGTMAFFFKPNFDVVEEEW